MVRLFQARSDSLELVLSQNTERAPPGIGKEVENLILPDDFKNGLLKIKS
jgi:hypothetical protein